MILRTWRRSAAGVAAGSRPCPLTWPRPTFRAASWPPQRQQRRGGGLHGLVMSHCESVDSSILDTTVESWDRHFAVNARAVWLLIKAFAQHLPAGQATAATGRIVALTSDHAVRNLPYGASKGALDRIVVAAAVELAGRGIRANVINPGPIDTGWMTPEILEADVTKTPAGRLGTPLTRPTWFVS